MGPLHIPDDAEMLWPPNFDDDLDDADVADAAHHARAPAAGPPDTLS